MPLSSLNGQITTCEDELNHLDPPMWFLLEFGMDKKKRPNRNYSGRSRKALKPISNPPRPETRDSPSPLKLLDPVLPQPPKTLNPYPCQTPNATKVQSLLVLLSPRLKAKMDRHKAFAPARKGTSRMSYSLNS